MSPIIIAIVVGLFLVGYLIWSFFILYHFLRFGVGTEPKKLGFIFIFGLAVLLVLALLLYTQLDITTVLDSF